MAKVEEMRDFEGGVIDIDGGTSLFQKLTHKRRTPLAQWIVMARGAKDWDQEILASTAETSPTTVAKKIETGTTYPQPRTLYRLGVALGIAPEKLLRLADETAEILGKAGES